MAKQGYITSFSFILQTIVFKEYVVLWLLFKLFTTLCGGAHSTVVYQNQHKRGL